MLRKIFNYQKLMYSSIPSPNLFQNNKAILAGLFFVMIVLSMTTSLFEGNLFTTYSGLAFLMAVYSIWQINQILNGDQPLFKMVPVSRQFTVFNIYLASVSIVTITFIAVSLSGAAIVGIITVIAYLIAPQSFPPEIVPADQLTAQGNVFMLLLLVITLFIGTTIAIIRNNRSRTGAYVAFFLLAYGLLAALKSVMPVSPNTGKVGFLVSLSLMPQANQLLMGVGIATLFIVPLSVYVGYKTATLGCITI
jgi:hypothetical protein